MAERPSSQLSRDSTNRRYSLPKATLQPKSWTLMEEDSKIAFGNCGVFDTYVVAANPLPFNVPVGTYLEEILIGLQCAPEPYRPQSGLGSNRSEKYRSERSEGRSEVDAGSKAKYNRLRRILYTKCLQDACQSLFWISLGIITNRVATPALMDLRSVLANAWGLVVLEVGQQVNRDMEAQDWVLGALPAILVQTVYRLFVDCFPAERSQFVLHADPLLNKLAQLVAYEVCGFQRDTETCLKERRQLFKKAVLDLPFLNQRDTVKAQARKELLEQKTLAPGPLNFGTLLEQGGEPLEDTQLEHVMTCREMDRKSQEEKGSQQGESALPPPVPAELSVERYDNLSLQSTEIFQRQFEELLPKPAVEDRPISQSSTESRRALAREGSMELDSPPKERPTSTSNKPQKYIRLMRAHTRQTQCGVRMMNNSVRKEMEAAERRKIEEQLKKKIVEDPLPSELCECSLDTTWVSPITNRLLPCERDRRVLRKPASDSYQLKMAPITANQKDLPPILVGSHSAPELGTSQTRFHTSTKKTQNAELPSIARGAARGKDEDAIANEMHKPRKPVHHQAESLVLEPPPSLGSKCIIDRLEAQRVTMQANSFGVYSQNFDITSGARRQKMDPAAVRRAESTYVSSMQELVGAPEEPALKMYDSPAQKVKRRFRKSVQ